MSKKEQTFSAFPTNIVKNSEGMTAADHFKEGMSLLHQSVQELLSSCQLVKFKDGKMGDMLDYVNNIVAAAVGLEQLVDFRKK